MRAVARPSRTSLATLVTTTAAALTEEGAA